MPLLFHIIISGVSWVFFEFISLTFFLSLAYLSGNTVRGVMVGHLFSCFIYWEGVF